jgi:hypothetical protein
MTSTDSYRGLVEALREMHAYAREAVQAAGCGFSGWEAAEKRALQALASISPEGEEALDHICPFCAGVGRMTTAEAEKLVERHHLATATQAPATTMHHHTRHPWAQPGDEPNRWWMLRFADPDMRQMVWNGPDAEQEAWAAYAQYSPAWNCYLFAVVPALASISPEEGAEEVLPPNASRQTRIAIAKALGLPFTSVNDRRIHRAYGALIAPATQAQREAVERVKAVAAGGNPQDVYGAEWSHDAARDFRKDLTDLLSLLESRHAG